MKRLFLCLVLIVALVVVGSVFVTQQYRKPGPLDQPVTLVIGKGSGRIAIAQELKSAQVISSKWMFVAFSHITRGPPLKAGEYAFPAHLSLQDVITLLQSGRVVIHHITIPEGLTSFQIEALLRAEPALSGTIDVLPPEGSLLPETYNFVLDDTRAGLLTRMKTADTAFLAQAWQKRAANLPYKNIAEAVTLASIVEKETGVPEERAKVAAVFLNRLKQGIRLQSDPTVIYALAGGQGPLDRPLTHQDLAVASPYNTYVSPGLPPGPICNPGRAAIEAVLHPDANGYLYFVATGNGGHAFAATLEEHNRNVAQWLNVMHNHPQ
jgi:UPF0755 protein